MRRAVRLGCGKRPLWVVALFAASALAVLLAEASDGRTHKVADPHLAVAAVVDVRALARVPEAPSGETNQEVREPQEKAEPSVRGAAPSRYDAPAHATATPSPYVSESFLAQADLPGVGSTKTEAPPDTNGAVGRDKLMVPLNSNYVIQRKSDGKVLSRVSMTAFWRPVGAHNPFDPRVLYDPYSDRWLASAADDPVLPSSLILYGISETGDPQGKWRLYALDADASNTTFADFPTLGFNQSTVAIGVNMFSNDRLNYVRGRLIVLDYPSLRAGGNGSPTDLNVPGGFALQPAVTYSASEPTLYLVEHLASESATFRFWALHGKTLTLVGGAPKTNPMGPWGTPGPANVLPQQNGRGIDAGDSRIGNAVFRNGHVYYAQTIAMPPGGTGFGIHTAAQWVELDTSGNFVQGGRVEDPGANAWNRGHSYAFASLAVNARNDVLVGFSEFQAGDFADAGYAYRAGTDPPGTMRAPVTLKDGEGPYEKDSRDARNRWGDYSGTAVDPSDDLSLWTVQAYARIPVGRGEANGRWGTWWGRVGGGPALPQPRCVVPHVVGKPLAKAWRRIADAYCRLVSVRRVRAAKKLRGRVVREAPQAGKRLPRDARVRLTVGR